MNIIDKQVGDILKHAEKKCTRVSKQSIHNWSPKLANAIKKERNIKKNIAKLRRCDLTTNITEVNIALQKEMEKLHSVRLESAQALQ